MFLSWPDAPDSLRGILRSRGWEPTRVASPAAAWPAFLEFLAVGLDGLEGCRGDDRFSVGWGHHAWSGGLPVLTFTRHLRVPPPEPRRWGLRLDMVFAADLAVGGLTTQDSGAYQVGAGAAMDEAVGEALWEVENHPGLRALWGAEPLWSAVSLGSPDARPVDTDGFDGEQRAAYQRYRARWG